MNLRYGVSLVAGGQHLGLLTLNTRITKDPFTPEDLDLLKIIADEAAAHLLNLRLAERLLRARQMEAFQTLSAFFVHDLKNLASQLSLTMQNIPGHFSDPDFRKDMQRTIEQKCGEDLQYDATPVAFEYPDGNKQDSSLTSTKSWPTHSPT